MIIRNQEPSPMYPFVNKKIEEARENVDESTLLSVSSDLTAWVAALERLLSTLLSVLQIDSKTEDESEGSVDSDELQLESRVSATIERRRRRRPEKPEAQPLMRIPDDSASWFIWERICNDKID